MPKRQRLYMPLAGRLFGPAIELDGEPITRSVADLCEVPGAVGFVPLYDSIQALQAVYGLTPFQAVDVRLQTASQEAEEDRA